MKVLRNISVWVIIAIFSLSSNGFILEQYLCGSCNSEHQEIAFFEFGELQHHHAQCSGCVENNITCSCQNDEHLNNTKISYFSLNILSETVDALTLTKIVTIKVLNNNLDLTKAVLFNYDFFFHNNFPLKLSLIPPIQTIKKSIGFSVLLSVFRF